MAVMPGAAAVVRVVVCAAPTILIVVFAGLVAMAALPCDVERRKYALDFAQKCIKLAEVIIGLPLQRPTGRPSGQELPPT
jgi:hypothetical protein